MTHFLITTDVRAFCKEDFGGSLQGQLWIAAAGGSYVERLG